MTTRPMTTRIRTVSDPSDLEVDGLRRVLAGERAEHVVSELLRAHQAALDDAGRRRLSTRIYGASVLRARLMYLTGSTDARALLRALDDEPRDRAWPDDVIERMCVERSAPAFMVRDLVDALGVAGADAFLRASNVPAPATLRANTLKCSRDELRARLREESVLTEPSPLASTALVVQGRANLFGTASWRDGWFEVQDASSQVCADLCAVQPGDVVLDLCAGRGGKTLALAAHMKNEGTLFVHDVDERALADMPPRLARAGVTCVRRWQGERARVVLVDAPCSSWGPLRRSPDLRWTQREHDLAAFPPLQLALIARARDIGARVVYATCTVRRAENHGAGRLLLPHVDGCDGFYVAHL